MKQSKTSGQNPNYKTLPTNNVLSSFLRKAQVSAAGLFWCISFSVYHLVAPCGVLSRRLGTANVANRCQGWDRRVRRNLDVALREDRPKKWANSWNFLLITIKAKCYLPKFCVLASNSRLSHQFQPNYNVFPPNLKGTNTRCKQVFHWRTHVL